jgi:methylated-DNA-protein-cysteine methyltransferase-like protein
LAIPARIIEIRINPGFSNPRKHDKSPFIMEAYTKSVIDVIKGIPRGKVCTYGLVGLLAGRPRGARQVVRILHTMTRKYDLPWHRVINSRGRISLPTGGGYEEQKARLQLEGVHFDKQDRIDLNTYLWNGDTLWKANGAGAN